MLENLSITDIFAAIVVLVGLIFLIYFGVKTLTTSNLFQQGMGLYQAGDYPEAETIFRQVIAINSTNDVVRLMLGETLFKQNQVPSAKELFEEVIKRSPKNPQGYLRLANVLMQEEQTAAAKENLAIAKDLLQKQRQPETAKRIDDLLAKMNSRANKS
ncbi:MAG TPA: tetratricopeptide repeat protein [Nostocaceae cyanobacterium]|nr:tetratricopeptide repeat protein [Nostocaceae cyanobacterium]